MDTVLIKLFDKKKYHLKHSNKTIDAGKPDKHHYNLCQITEYAIEYHQTGKLKSSPMEKVY